MTMTKETDSQTGLELRPYDAVHLLVVWLVIAILSSNAWNGGPAYAAPAAQVITTFLGGTSSDRCRKAVVDDSGYVYVVGITASTDFPLVPGPHFAVQNGVENCFVAKFSPDLTELLASTCFGGSGYEATWAVAIDADGNVYVGGCTVSDDFPTTTGTYCDSLTGGSGNNEGGDAFIVKFPPNLDTLLASTYLGGSEDEGSVSIALADNGTVYVSGHTASSTDFPTSSGAYSESYNGGVGYGEGGDVFITHMDASLTSVIASTYLGGSNYEIARHAVIDEHGRIWVCGLTASSDYPFTPGAYDSTYGGGTGHDGGDMYISCLSPELDSLIASTYMGDYGNDWACAIALDGNNKLFVTGHTSSYLFPTTPGAYDVYPDIGDSNDDAFVSRLSYDLTTLEASTFLGGNDWEMGVGLEIDDAGNVCVGGQTSSTDFPTATNGYDRVSLNSEGFVTRLDNDLSELLPYSTCLGGSSRDRVIGIAAGHDGSIYAIGQTQSADFPMSERTYDMDYDGGGSGYFAGDGFVSRVLTSQFKRIEVGDIVNDGGGSGSVNWIDVNNDGYEDLFVSNSDYPSTGRPYLYMNLGDGAFVRTTGDPIVSTGNTGCATFGDYNNDGNIDAFVGGYGDFYLNLLHGLGAGSFAFTPAGISDQDVLSASWSDYDADGDLDLYLGTTKMHGHRWGQPNMLYRNDNGVFTRISENAIVADTGYSYGVAWSDYDGDGDQDLFTTNFCDEDNPDGFDYIGQGNRLYRNNGDGTFVSTGEGDIVSAIGGSFGGSWGDYDNDGDQDLYVTNAGVGDTANFLYRNDGGDNFTGIEGGEEVNIAGNSRSGSWGDFDNDGYLDIVVTTFGGSLPNYLFHNNGDGTFTRVFESLFDNGAVMSVGSAWGDYDKDGDLDLVIANYGSDNELFENTGNGNNWISVQCVGVISNKSAIGTKVRVKSVIGGLPVRQLREISAQTGFNSQSSLRAHCGLGDAASIDSILVEWPSGYTDTLLGVEPNQLLVVFEGQTLDLDSDGIAGADDNCPLKHNPGQEDQDGNGIGNACDSCCIPPTVGDIDQSGGIDITDVSVLIDNQFLTLAALVCDEEGDVDFSGWVDITDLSILIDNQFLTLTPLPGCP